MCYKPPLSEWARGILWRPGKGAEESYVGNAGQVFQQQKRRGVCWHNFRNLWFIPLFRCEGKGTYWTSLFETELASEGGMRCFAKSWSGFLGKPFQRKGVSKSDWSCLGTVNLLQWATTTGPIKKQLAISARLTQFPNIAGPQDFLLSEQANTCAVMFWLEKNNFKESSRQLPCGQEGRGRQL